MARPYSLALVACPGGEAFAQKIDQYLCALYANTDTSAPVQSFLIPSQHTVFANGEVKASVGSSIRGKNVFIIQDVANQQPVKIDNQSYRFSINDHLLSLFVTLDAVRSCGANQISLVLPYFPYSRQHVRKGRECLAAAYVSNQLESLGANRIITLDIHCKEIENAFRKTNLENLHPSYQLMRELLYRVNRNELIVVSPDLGGLGRNRFFANALGCPLGTIYKERDYNRISSSAENSNIVKTRLLGDVQDATVFIADDILGTGGTMIKAMQILKENGAKDIVVGVSLPLFNGEAVAHFEKAYQERLFSYLIGTNGVMLSPDVLNKEWFIEADISKFFGQVIDRIYHNRSLARLLDNREMVARLYARHPDLVPKDKVLD